MVAYGPVDVILEFVACGAVLLTSAVLVMHWHPLLHRVRDWCKAGIAHSERDRLLHLVGLTPIAWGLALGIYIRNVYLISRIMAEMPKKQLGDRVLSTLLDLYLSFVSFCGFIGLIVTIYYIYSYREDLRDLLMVIKFNAGAHRQPPDLELQRLSLGDFASPNLDQDTRYRGATTSSDNRPTRRRSRDIGLHGTDAQRHVGDASPPQLRRPNHTWNPFSSNADRMELEREVRERAYRRVVMNNGGDGFLDIPPSPSRAEADSNSRQSSLETVGEPPSLASDHGSDGPEPFREAPARAQPPTSYNVDGVDECPLHRCASCSESHSATIPHTRRAAVREPLTPTSPIKAYGRSAMWSRLIRNPSGEVQADGAQQPLLAGHDVWPDHGGGMSVASTVSDVGDDFPDELERYDRAIIEAHEPRTTSLPAATTMTEPEISDSTSNPWDEDFDGSKSSGVGGERLGKGVQKELGREELEENRRSLAQSQQIQRASDRGQAISATLALHKGVPIPSGPSRQVPASYPGPRGNLPPSPLTRHPDLISQNRTLFGSDLSSPLTKIHTNPRPTRVMADPRMVQLGGADGPATIARVASPHLRVVIPGAPAVVHGRTPALGNEESRARRKEGVEMEDWTEEHGYPYRF